MLPGTGVNPPPGTGVTPAERAGGVLAPGWAIIVAPPAAAGPGRRESAIEWTLAVAKRTPIRAVKLRGPRWGSPPARVGTAEGPRDAEGVRPCTGRRAKRFSG